MKDFKNIHTGLLAVFAFAAVSTAGMMLWSGEPGRLYWWPFALGFYAWAAAPYVVLAILAWRFRDGAAASSVVLATAGILAAGGLFLQYKALFVNLDPQSGLVFLVVPFYQLVAAALACLLVLVVHATSARLEQGGS